MKLPELDPAQPPRILVVGDLMIDRYLWGTCDRVSPEAPVQVVNVASESYALGGAGNVVANLASLGAKPQLVALVGSDLSQTRLPALLSEWGVSSDGLVRDDERPTTVKTRLLAAKHQIVRFDVESSAQCSEQCATELIERAKAALEQTDVVILSDYGKGLLTPRVARALIELCHARKVPVLVDPKGRDYEKYRGASLLTPNRREAAQATGIALDSQEHIRSAGRKLSHELGLGACLITLSEDGMALFHDQREFWLATEAREVFDVTGAGDTVIAAVAFGLAAGLPLADACRFANRAAGVVVGKVGSATVTLDELRAHRSSASFSRPEDKILEPERLLREVGRLRGQGQKIVFTNGCFDLLHAGHVQYLSRAANLGDVLIVGLNSDASVRRLKGERRPLNRESDRALLLAALSAVSYVVLFGEDTPLSLIRSIAPDVLVKGGDYVADQIVGADLVRAAGGSVEVLPFVAGHSTSALIERARRDS